MSTGELLTDNRVQISGCKYPVFQCWFHRAQFVGNLRVTAADVTGGLTTRVTQSGCYAGVV